jgi:hypothetical protein
MGSGRQRGSRDKERYRVRRHAKALVIAVLVLLCLGSTAALAITTHPFESSFGSLGTPETVAVDQASGEVYVLEQSAGQISRFDEAGAAAPFSASASFISANHLSGTTEGPFSFAGGGENQIAVAPPGSPGATAGDIYVAEPNAPAIDVFASSGAYLGRITEAEGSSIGEACGVATDPAGNLYVGTYPGTVEKYVPSANPPTNADFDSKITGLNGICNIAASSTQLFASTWGSGPLTSYPLSLFPGSQGEADASASGTVVEAEGGPVPSRTATVDPASDDLYVDEGNRIAHFDSSGTLLAHFGGAQLTSSNGVAVNETSGKAYASDASEGKVFTFGPLALLPTPTTEGVTANTSGHTATLHGKVNPEGTATTWQFAYGTSKAYGSLAPASAQSAGSGSAEVPVSTELSGLTSGTTYHYALKASNGDGSEVGQDMTFATPAAPSISEVSVSDVTESEVKLNATVNPGGSATSYRFEYTGQADFEANGFANAVKVPLPDEALGSGSEGVAVSQEIAGLSLDTPYRYRVLATSAVETTESAAKAFKTLAKPEFTHHSDIPGKGLLPDNRAWEMVSPPNKNGGEAIPDVFMTRVAADGSAASFASFVAFGDAIGTGDATNYVSLRSADSQPGDNGWSTHAITPPQKPVTIDLTTGAYDHYWSGAFSPDLDSGVFAAPTPLTDDPNVANVPGNLYVRDDLRTPGHGHYQLLTACPLCEATSTPLPPLPSPTTERFAPVLYREVRSLFAGASPDFGHVLFETRRNLTADAPDQPEGCSIEHFPGVVFCAVRLYEWDHGTTRYAGRIPVDPATSCDDSGAPACVSAPVSIAGQGPSGFISNTPPNAPGVISDGSDGHSRIFLTFPTEDGVTPSPIGSTDPAGNLYVRVDHEVTDQLNASEREGGPAEYRPAKFLDASADGQRAFFITGAALTDDASTDNTPKIYMYDASKPGSDPHNLTLIAGEEAVGITGISADGTYVYMLIRENGPDRIELWHDGALTSIGQLKTDNDHTEEDNLVTGPQYNLRAGIDIQQARVTPDGRHLLFAARDGAGLLSSRGGEDYDHGTCHPEFSVPQPCRELYLYDAETDSLQCASCNPSGEPGSGFTYGSFSPAFGGPAAEAARLNHPLSDDGRYVFFTTAEALVPRDINGVNDAYEFDSSTGKPHLLSSGEDPRPSYFMDASDDGSDAFIATAERLSGWDRDEAGDLYDARIGGGFPEPSPPPPSCQGDACQPPPTDLRDPTPSSASFAGPGNVTGQRKRAHRRCRHASRAGHHSKRHHLKGAKGRCGARAKAHGKGRK